MPSKRPVFKPNGTPEPQNPGGSDPFYMGRRWRNYRKWYAANNPLCVMCLEDGRTVPLDVVDHIVARKDGGAEYDPDNTQSLCHTHHNRKHG